MKPDLESIKRQFKEDIIRAAREQAKERISQEDLERLNPSINHFVYLTGYSAKELEEKVDIVVEALPDEFFKQTFRKTKIKTASLIAEEFLSSHYNLSNDSEFLDFLYELVDKIAGLFKESVVESLIGKPIEPLVKAVKSKANYDNLFKLLKTNDKEVVASEAIKYLNYLIKKGDLLHPNDLSGNLNEKLECINEYLDVVQLSTQLPKYFEDWAYSTVDTVALSKTKQKLEVIAMSGKEGGMLLSNGLTKRQEFALKLLSKAQGRTEEQIVFLQDFIKDSMGDMRLNGTLSKLLNSVPRDITKSSVEFMKEFTFKTKDTDVFLAATEKLVRNYNKVESGEEPDPNDKVTLREYGILMKYASLEVKFEKFHNMGIIQNDVELGKIHAAVKSCALIIKELNGKIEKEIEYESGDIMMHNIQKENEIKNELRVVNKVASIITAEHLHTMKLFVGSLDATVTLVSHMHEGSVGTDIVKMREYLFSDLYKIKIEKLVVGKFEDKLQKIYGPNYIDKINKMYRKIEFDIHENAGTKFKNVTLESFFSIAKAGLADFLPFFGHTKVNPDNLDKLHTKMMADVVEAGEMICSEFAARTTAAAFIDLNKKLQTALVTTENVIDIPFDARERFSKINPDRLLKILAAKGCIEEAPRTKTENQFITFADKVKASSPAQLGR